MMKLGGLSSAAKEFTQLRRMRIVKERRILFMVEWIGKLWERASLPKVFV
tara:strand:- start:1465 stop:1614 length:150 start_codon:yes stop_codon:yes gene_type:complete